MSIGFPDGQRITQWLGAPIVQAGALAIGNVLHTDGPFNLASWASVVVAIKPTGGSVTVTVRQRVSGGPASLELPETFIVQAGQVGFESIVLFGDAVYLDLLGSAPGVTVDYALYPSNTTTNAQVLATATINVQHNEALVAAEPTIDFVDANGFVWSIADDAANTRVKAQIASLRTLIPGQGNSITSASVINVDHDFHSVVGGTNVQRITVNGGIPPFSGCVVRLGSVGAVNYVPGDNILPTGANLARSVPSLAAVTWVYSASAGAWLCAGVGS